jgi:hypothetical protein
MGGAAVNVHAAFKKHSSRTESPAAPASRFPFHLSTDERPCKSCLAEPRVPHFLIFFSPLLCGRPQHATPRVLALGSAVSVLLHFVVLLCLPMCNLVQSLSKKIKN